MTGQGRQETPSPDAGEPGKVVRESLDTGEARDRLDRLRESLGTLRGALLRGGWLHSGTVPEDLVMLENMHGDPPPLPPGAFRGVSADLVIVDEIPGPLRMPDPVCECLHPKSGHSIGSVVFRDQCWNCRECTGFRMAEG